MMATMGTERRPRTRNQPSWLSMALVVAVMLLIFYRTSKMNKFDLNEARQSVTHDNDGRTSLAFRDSLGFFTDVTNEEWIIRRDIARKRIHNAYPEYPAMHANNPATWYQENWDPAFSCAMEDKIGNVGDGHKWICDVDRLKSQKECIVYSVGSNGDFSFEVALQKRLPSCVIHIFDLDDFTSSMPRGLKAHFHHWGFKPSYYTNTTEWDTGFSTQPWSDPARPHLKFKTLDETMDTLGHSRVDIFKIDCEGCEWQSFKDWTSADLRQILVEVHDSPAAVVNDFFQTLQNAGFVLFHKEANTQFANGKCQEVGFLKIAKSFFTDA